MPTAGMTHPIRILRNVQQRGHSLSLREVLTETTGEDAWARLLPSSAEVFTMDGVDALGVTLALIDLAIPTRYDVAVGYVVEVKKPRVVDGEITQVAGTLVTAADEGDKEVFLDTVVGFEPGDRVVLSEGTAADASKIKAVDAATGKITLYDDRPLSAAFTDAATAKVTDFFRVTRVQTPQAFSKIRIVTARQVAWGGMPS